MAKRDKKHDPNWGGVREGAGRPALMDDRVTVSVTLDRSHIERLEAYGQKVGVTGRSAALRHLIEKKAG